VRSCGISRRVRRRGLTLIEVIVSILLVMVVILAAIGTRYLATQQARRGDAYSTAGKLGLMLLEAWRSSTAPSTYNPITTFAGQMTVSTSGTGPPAPTDFTTLGSYHVVLDNVHYYPTLAYIGATTEQPAVLHVSVAFRQNYQAGTISTGDNCVRLTTYD
jgi:type II secretory pathway pseudopilin PulG